MSFKPYFAHYKNKYGGMVHMSENTFDVYNKAGELCVALRKDGNGQIKDCSKEFGCKDEHDLAPIEKKFRAHKLYKDGNIAPSEEYAERKAFCDDAISKEGKIYSEYDWNKIKAERAKLAAEAAANSQN